MIKRRNSKGDETPHCNSIHMGELYRSQINGLNTGMRIVNDQKNQTDPLLSLEPPIFNIHIHIPPYNGENFQMHLPRLHPIIHLHFDEIAKKLEIRRGQNEKDTYRMFKSLLAMTSPTFGHVKFYTSHRSQDGGIRETEAIPTSTTRTTITSEKTPVGLGPILNKTIKYPQNRVPKRKKYYGQRSFHRNNQRRKIFMNQRNQNSKKQTIRDFEKEFKLKKAVVLLTDICKSEYYKNLCKTSSGVSTKERIEDYHDSERTESAEDNSQLCEKPFIKTEIESPEPESPQLENYEEFCASPLKITPSSNEVGNIKCEMNVNYDMNKSLISLVEGCNFSEILNRFRIKKCEEHLVDSVKKMNAPTVQNNVNNSDHSYSREPSEQNSHHDNKVVINETWAGDTVPCGNESELTIEEHFDWKLSNDESKTFNLNPEEISTCVDIKFPSDSLNASTIPQSDVEHDLLVDEKVSDDENEVPKEFPNQKIIRATSNSEIEIVSCGTSPFLVPVNRFQFIKSDDINSDYNSNINLQLELIKKEMARRNMKTSNSRKKKSGKGVKRKSLKSPSERKKSKVTEQQKTDNSPHTDDYIPLQATGPTRFAVAPLNKVSPYKNHDARDFKNKMLFGNRVNRFSSADQLRLYKMKKNAGKRTSV